MNRNVQNLLLVAAGGVLVWIAVDGTYLRYVKATALPWLIASAVALVLIGLILLWADNEAKLAARILGEAEYSRQRPHAQPSCADTEAHDHGRLGGVVPWLLVLPLLALFLVQPRELGAFTAERRAAQVEQPTKQAGAFEPIAGADPVDVPLLDLTQRAVYGGEKTLRGRTLVVSGFVTPRKGSQPGDFYINRMFLNCCAADATPVRVRITGAGKDFRKETWVKVTGSYTGNETLPDTTLDPIPTLRVDTIKRIPVPDEPYAN
ncbi:MAG: TIGR03943 family protein [Streptosporangiales bacterium]|nr:TIGR03943 family protein [Streptosporangiales bacterium]